MATTSEKKEENPNSPVTIETPEINPPKPKVEAGVKKPSDVAKVQPPTEIKAEFPSDYYKSLGMAVCPKCGSKKQTDGYRVICAVKNADCPMMKEFNTAK